MLSGLKLHSTELPLVVALLTSDLCKVLEFPTLRIDHFGSTSVDALTAIRSQTSGLPKSCRRTRARQPCTELRHLNSGLALRQPMIARRRGCNLNLRIGANSVSPSHIANL